jgi:two-component system chemotaxis response regulator CheB
MTEGASMDIPVPTASSKNSSYDIVVVGGSAGAIRVLEKLLGALPARFPMPILVVQHLSARSPSVLDMVLARRTELMVKWAVAGEWPSSGIVYLSPPSRQLLIAQNGTLELAPLSTYRRWGSPSADLLFESAAKVFGERAISIILSGALWDGARGTAAIKLAGGLPMAQSVMTCDTASMPQAAIDLGRAEVALSPDRLAVALCTLAQQEVLTF